MGQLAGAYTQIFIMLAIIVVGYVATKLNYITKAGFNSISDLLIHIALPCLIVSSVAELNPGTGGAQVPWFFAMAFAQFVLLILFTYLLNKLLRAPDWQRPIYLFGNVCTNTGFLCLPILAAVYGEQTVLGASIYVLMCNLFLGTFGVAALEAGDPTRRALGDSTRRPSDNSMHGASSASAPYESSKAAGMKLRFSVRSLWNAPLIACIFALILFFSGLRLPGMVETCVDTIGSVCVPLAMMVVGSALAQSDFKSIFSDGRLYVFVGIRQLIIPAVFYLVLVQFIHDPMLLWVFTVMFAAPVGVMAPAWTNSYHQDGTFAARFTVVSTLASFIFIPLLITLMGVI